MSIAGAKQAEGRQFDQSRLSVGRQTERGALIGGLAAALNATFSPSRRGAAAFSHVAMAPWLGSARLKELTQLPWTRNKSRPKPSLALSLLGGFREPPLSCRCSEFRGGFRGS